MSQELISNRIGTDVGQSSRTRRLARRILCGRLDQIKMGQIMLQESDWQKCCGSDPSFMAQIQIHDPRFYSLTLRRGALGAAEAYVNGWWSSEDLVGLLRLMVRNLKHSDRLGGWRSLLRRPVELVSQAFRSNTRSGSRRNIHAHYDLGNDFFKLFLDDTMTYSAGIFPTTESTLQEASETKLDRLIAKLGLGPDDHLLEIGTGWGSMSIRAARTTGCRVTTTTISREQAREARERVTDAGLEKQITILETDYRDLQGTFDGVVAVEMIEAVGHRFLPAFFQACSERLKPEGRLVLQAIAMPDHRYARYLRNTDFIREVVFPGSCCPSVAAMNQAVSENTDLKLTHLEDMAPHYAMTLHRWRVRFNEQLDQVRELGLDDQFIRMWDYYLSYCEAGFAEDYIRSVQMVYERNDNRVMTSLDPIPELETTS
ncbi:MAG: cyclopropane-fatty-acyl-phospholipid synthase family protein [Phycisphaerales bacterium]|nr:cyclopropane-fatty-acyl-phospholipid synthase family protein [Phycisphaerales bacterium]